MTIRCKFARLRVLFIVFATLLIYVSTATAETEVHGDVSGIWSLDESPFIATDTVSVPRGQQLTIEPGVEVRFSDRAALLIYGGFSAIGTVDDSIFFLNHNPEAGERWAGLVLSEADDSSSIAYSHIDGAGWTEQMGNDARERGQGVSMIRCSPILRNSLITACWGAYQSHWDAPAVYVYGHSDNITPIISNCTIEGNYGGITCLDANALIENNQIHGNIVLRGRSYYGIGILIGGSTSKVIVRNNLVTGSQTGLWVSYCSEAFIYGNVVRDNGRGVSPLHWGMRLENSRCAVYDNLVLNVNQQGDGGFILFENQSQIIFNRNLVANLSGRWEGEGLSIDDNVGRIQINGSVFWGYGDGALSILAPSKATFVNCIYRWNANITGAELLVAGYSDVSQQLAGPGMINQNPLFVDPANGDFHLQDNSPCIDAGDPMSLYNNSEGERTDMGLYGGNDLLFGFGDSISFPTISTFTTASDSIVLCNVTDNPIRLSRLEIDDPDNFGFENVEQMDLEPFVWYSFPIVFHPIEPGDHNAVITIAFENYQPVQEAEIPVRGSALDGLTGVIEGVLSREYSPYHVIGVIQIPNASTLTIESGVELQFDAGTGIDCVAGSSLLIASGTIEDSIRFVSAVDNPEPADYWRGIKKNGVLSYCLIENAVRGLERFGGVVEHTLIKNCSVVGADLNPLVVDSSVARHCRIEDCELGVNVAKEGKLEKSVVVNCGVGVTHTDGGMLFRSLLMNCGNVTLASHRFNGRDSVLYFVETIGNIFYRDSSLVNLDTPHPKFENNLVYESTFEGASLIGDFADWNMRLTACDSNQNVQGDPLFVDIDAGDFRPQRNSPLVDGGAIDWELDPDSSIADIGLEYFDQGNLSAQRIRIESGWSIISLNVVPNECFFDPNDNRGPVPEMMLRPIERDLFILKDDLGRFYIPRQDHFNNIPYWNQSKGYFIKLTTERIVLWSGALIPGDTPINLDRGWNLVAYYPHYELPVRSPDFLGFESIRDNLLIAKDAEGKFAAPRLNFSNMPALLPGKGYFIKVDQDIDLIYPAMRQNVLTSLQPTPVPKHFTVPVNTGKNMSLLVTIEMPRSQRYEIGVLTPDGVCVGAAVLSERTIGLPIWGDDPTTKEIDGAMEGALLSIRFWDGKREFAGNLTFLEGDDHYHTDGLALASLESVLEVAPTDFTLSAPFPNPFNTVTTITYSLPDESAVDLAIFDVMGREITTLVNRVSISGTYRVSWDGTNRDGVPMTTGIYFIRLETPTLTKVNKMTLMK